MVGIVRRLGRPNRGTERRVREVTGRRGLAGFPRIRLSQTCNQSFPGPYIKYVIVLYMNELVPHPAARSETFPAIQSWFATDEACVQYLAESSGSPRRPA